MKNAIRLTGILLVTGFVLAGCYVMVDDGVGSVGIQLPDANSAGDPAEQSVARIYLLNGTSLVDISNDGSATDVLYKTMDIDTVENEVSLGPVPSGPGYQVIVVLGDPQPAGDTDVFVPEKYAVSESFAVVAGQATPVDLETVASPFSYAPDVLGEDLVGIVEVGGSLYSASVGETGSALRLDAGLNVTNTAALPAGEEATGIDLGALIGSGAVPWINTTKGIIPYLGGNTFSATELDFDGDYPPDSVLPAVLDSGAFIAGGGDLYGWFQTDGGLGGVYDELLSTGDKQWLSDIDLGDFISGQPVYDLAVDFSGGSVEGYFASKLGAFRLPEVVLTDPEINTVPEILDAASFFDVTVDGEAAVITDLALAGADLYLGTSKGVMSIQTADIEMDTIPTSDTITESLGRTVQELAIGATYRAILTGNFLIVSGDNGLSYTVLPIYASIVTAPTAMYLDDTSGIVIISGETGMATLDIDSL